MRTLINLQQAISEASIIYDIDVKGTPSNKNNEKMSAAKRYLVTFGLKCGFNSFEIAGYFDVSLSFVDRVGYEINHERAVQRQMEEDEMQEIINSEI